MASNLNEILGRNIDSVKSLKSAIKELQDSLVGLDTESKEYEDTSKKLIAAQDALKNTTRAGAEANIAAKDSLVGMQKEYNSLYDAYKKLTEEQRNSDFGKEMAQSLETLSSKINDTKKDVGNFTNNIGRYAQGATEAFSKMGISIGALQQPLKLAAGGVKTLGASLKALIANPVGAVIMAIVVAFKALTAIAERVKKAINDNEESTGRLKVALSVFKPVVDAVSNAFDFLGKVVVKVIEGLSKVAEKIMSVIPGMRKAIQSHKELAKATNDLTKAQREANIENSKKEAEIERLREEASETDNVVEKRKLLEEAKALQAEIDQKNIEIAQEELRIMQEYGEKTANSAEENEKLAAAQIKVNNAISQGERNMRMYNKQISATETKTESAGSATVDYKKKAKELYEQTIEDSKTEVQKLTEKYEKEKKLLEKYHYDTKLLTKKYGENLKEVHQKSEEKRLQIVRENRQKEITVWNNWYNNVARYYKNAQDEATEYGKTAVNQATEYFIRDAIEQLNVINDVANLYKENTIGATRDMLDIIFNEADLTQITDYGYIKSFLEKNLSEDELGPIMEAFKNYGEESWAAFVDAFEKEVKLANEGYGLDIKNMPDVEARAKKLGVDLAENVGESFNLSVDEFLTKSNTALFDAVFSGITNGARMDETRDFIAREEYKILDTQARIYKEQIDSFSGTQEQKLAILQAYYNTVEEMAARTEAMDKLWIDRRRALWDDSLNAVDALTSSLNSMFDSIMNVIEAEKNSGQITEREAKRKEKALKNLEAIQLAVSIAGIAANTAAGIMDVWRGYASELVLNAQTAAATGPAAAATKAALDAKSKASAIIRTASIGTQGAAQIAAAIGGYIAKNVSAAEDSGGGLAATPALIDSSAYGYTKVIQDTEPEDEFNKVNLWVSVTDIEHALNQKVKVTSESTF